MARREEIFTAMRDYLRISNSEWEIAPGSPEFKILESVAVQLEGMTFDAVLNDYHWDIDKKNGVALDEFVSLFGFTRIPASRATGTVMFKRGTPAVKNYSIPRGTQVYVPAKNGVPAIYFQTTETVILQSGQYDVLAPIEATLGGSIGNTAAGNIVSVATVIEGITAVENTQATTGGTDGESDDDLRIRWRTTVFRNISGTEDQFLAQAYSSDPSVAHANVVSGVERYSEQIQLTGPQDLSTTNPWKATLTADADETITLLTVSSLAGLPAVAPFYIAYYDTSAHEYTELMRVCSIIDGVSKALEVQRGTRTTPYTMTAADGELRVVIPSSVNDAKYVYPSGNEIISSSTSLLYLRRGSDYNFITEANVAGNFVSVLAYYDISDRVENVGLPFVWFTPAAVSKVDYESLLDMYFDYTPYSSQNIPPNSLEKVDIFIDGISETIITEELAMSGTRFTTVNDDVSDTVDYRDFMRMDGSRPVENNMFLQLSQTPIVDIDDEITIQASVGTPALTYYKNQDYWLVEQVKDSNNVYVKGSSRAIAGIEWRTFNYEVGLVTTSLSSSTTTVGVTPDTGSGFSSPLTTGGYVFYIQIEDERMKVTGVSGTSLTVVRGQQGTTASTHASGLPVYVIDSGTVLSTAAVNAVVDGHLGDFSTDDMNYYGYVVTRMINGIESAASEIITQQVTPAGGLLSKVTLSITDYFPKTGGNSTFYIYRSKQSSSSGDAADGPFYYLGRVYVGYPSSTATFTDNAFDSKLHQSFAPSQTPATNRMLQFSYRVNQAVSSVTQLTNISRLVGQDTTTHVAELVPLKFNFSVMADTNNVDLIKSSLITSMDDFLMSKDFQSDVQLADVFERVMLDSGVDNVRLTKQSEARNEEQGYLVYSDRTGGGLSTDTYTLSLETPLGDIETTEDIQWDETAVDVRRALESLPSVYEGFNNISNIKFASASESVTFTDTGDTVDLNSHGLSTGTRVWFSTITTTTGISTNTLYYVVNPTTNAFQVSTTSGGSAAALTTNGSGTLRYQLENKFEYTNAAATWPSASATSPFYLQISDDYQTTDNSGTGTRTLTDADEILAVIAVDTGNKHLTVLRSTLDSGSIGNYNDLFNTSFSGHLIGDVAVTRSPVQGASTANPGTEANPYQFNITFLGSRWGLREVPLLQILASESLKFKSTATSSAQTEGPVIRKTRGLGWGIQRFAQDGLTIVEIPAAPCTDATSYAYTSDFYLKMHEIPMLVTVDVLIKGRNTF